MCVCVCVIVVKCLGPRACILLPGDEVGVGVVHWVQATFGS